MKCYQNSCFIFGTILLFTGSHNIKVTFLANKQNIHLLSKFTTDCIYYQNESNIPNSNLKLYKAIKFDHKLIARVWSTLSQSSW